MKTGEPNKLARTDTDSKLWEIFHENTKLTRFSPARPKSALKAWLAKIRESKTFTGYPVVVLPKHHCPANMSLETAIGFRRSTYDMKPISLRMGHLASILRLAYGITSYGASSKSVSPRRAVPSAGALYPLELFILSRQVKGLHPGLYHYNPSADNLRLIRKRIQYGTLNRSFLQSDIPSKSSILILITAMFERTTYKYFDRGYRHVLLEAGHAAQNINLTSTALGLSSLNIGGFLDREIDAFLGVDGVTHSTLYIIAVGGKYHGNCSTRE